MQRNPLVNNRKTGFICNTCVFVFPGTCVVVYLHFLHFYLHNIQISLGAVGSLGYKVNTSVSYSSFLLGYL